MDDAGGVGCFERPGRLARQVGHAVDLHQACAIHQRAQVVARHVLHGEEGQLVGAVTRRLAVPAVEAQLDQRALVELRFADLEDDCDIRVIETRGGARLAQESRPPLQVFVDLGQQDLDCHRAAQAGILRPVDSTHGTEADLFSELEMGKLGRHILPLSSVESAPAPWRKGRVEWRAAKTGNHNQKGFLRPES